MKILLLLAHPNPESLNAAIAERVRLSLEQAGHQVIYHDLYKEGFDPLLPAGEISKQARISPELDVHCQEFCTADGIVAVHPNWWGMPPAVLTGYIDRVVRPGRAYEFLDGDAGEGVPRGLIKARAALVLNTSDTAPRREREVFGDPLERIWKDCVFGLCGVKRVERRIIGIVVTSTPEERRAWLDQASSLTLRLFPSRL